MTHLNSYCMYTVTIKLYTKKYPLTNSFINMIYNIVYFLENFLLTFLHKFTVDERMSLIVEIGVHFVGSSFIFHIPLSFCDAIIWCCNSIRSNSSSGADREESCSGVKSLTLQIPCPIRVAFILWSLMYWKKKQSIVYFY